nr:hypothetical protein [Tanacetum cinerariifolium]
SILQEKIDDPNITMEEYVKLEEEKARRHSRTFNWQTAMFSKIKHYEDEDDYYINFETEFPAIVFDNTTIPSEPKNTDLENDKHLLPHPTVDPLDDLDNFDDFENEFLAIVYNNDLTSKSDLGIKPLKSYECIDEIDLIEETSLSKYDEENISRFNDLFIDIRFDDSKSKKEND